ncbi:MAG: hypothetical protein IKV87_05105 [Methanobrevibacter sp.]|nr:hypothetical protein [Methanobrevibacter sp.]
MGRILIPNYEFVENWSEDQLNDFLTTPAGLPHKLMHIVRKVYPNINYLRGIARSENPNLRGLDQEERAVTYKLPIHDARKYHIDYALDFLEKYPQFKPMIKGVKEV